jgi:hypothetical protein
MRKPPPFRSAHIDHRSHGTAVAAALGVAALLLCGSIPAQYVFDPSAAHELEKSGNKYFGSAKDDKGVLIAGVTVLLEADDTNYVLTTDEQGRFRTTLPGTIAPKDVKAKCWRDGYQFVRVNKRLAPKGALSPVQVDCVLRLAAT